MNPHREQQGDHPLVIDYLRRLDAAGWALPGGQRAELLAEIHGHVTEGLAGLKDEASVRNVLQRLGSPEEIVAAAGDDRMPYAAASTSRSPHVGLVEIGAVLLLSLGTVMLPGIGWLVGVWLLWSSPLWRKAEKVVGSLLLPACVTFFLISPMLTSGLPAVVSLNVFVWTPPLLALLILVVPGYLFVVAARRARAGRASLVPMVAATAGATGVAA